MSPLLQSELDRQKLLDPHIIILFCWREAAGEESTGMELPILFGPLGQDHSYPRARGVYLYNKLSRGIRMHEDGGRSEMGFKVLKGLFDLG